MTNNRISVYTKEEKLRGIPKRWKEQYHDGYYGGRGTWLNEKSKNIYDKLVKMKSYTAESVAEIIGNDCWGQLTCNVCYEDVDVVIQIETPWSDEHGDMNMCLNCLNDGVKKITDTTTP